MSTEQSGMLLLRRLAGTGRQRGLAGIASVVPREAADALLVGAGVVGLAVARSLAMAGREVVAVEAAPSLGTGTSSRNSKVIHAGIYYPPLSIKVRPCVPAYRPRLGLIYQTFSAGILNF